MHILFVRVGICVQESGYSYRLYIPFADISLRIQRPQVCILPSARYR